jgi:hypothetical protein
MQLKFEKFRDRLHADKYRAVLVSTHHCDGDEPERIEIAELEKREVMGSVHRCDWAIEWRHPALAHKDGQRFGQRFTYKDLFNDAKRAVEDAVLTLLRGEKGS